ncbi:hypothetical protein BG011_000858 [Mortierella polycephala]|uniref:Cytochrome b-c1 complex subunit 8 n=1 Tax=Mortierella polycephala TaxID=41804 RepID=A0A9P6QER6_9FUNG|nr:hypothetical protein BG011_000858 [Mortierella polycephala]
MAGGKWMGWWGHLGAPKQRGIAVYSLSPFEQRAFAGAFHQAVFNTFRRVSGQVFYIAIPFGAAYGIYSWGKEDHLQAAPINSDKNHPQRIKAQAVPYIPPPNNIPPDEWGNRILDFSSVGYRNGHVPLPQLPVQEILKPSGNPKIDDRKRIQDALDRVGALPLRPYILRDNHTVICARGAVLLRAGTYRIKGSLILNKQGVVLRGEGTDPLNGGTVLIATGRFVHEFIHMNGMMDSDAGKPNSKQDPKKSPDIPRNRYIGKGEAIPVADEKIPVGTTRVPVKNIIPFTVGDEIVVDRAATQAWIDLIGMSRIPERPDNISTTKQWPPDQFDLKYVRKIVAIEQRSPEDVAAFVGRGVVVDGSKSDDTPGPIIGDLGQNLTISTTAKASTKPKKKLPSDDSLLDELFGNKDDRSFFLDTPPGPYMGDEGMVMIKSAINETMMTAGLYMPEPALGTLDKKGQWKPTAKDDPSWIPGYLILESPLAMDMDPIYGSGRVYLFERQYPIPTDIGVENLVLLSEYNNTKTPAKDGRMVRQDERHAWYAIMLDNCEHCWVSDVRTHFFVSGIKVNRWSIHITVQDMEVMDPVSEPTTGGRRYPYVLQGQFGLVKRCYARDARHDFMTAAKTAGPNVFVDSMGSQANNDAGPHDRWASGILYDNIRTSALNVRNRSWMGSGQGWSGVYHVIYHCTATNPTNFESPPRGTNWVIGIKSKGSRSNTPSPEKNATFLDEDAFNEEPRSLYWAQLVKRVGGTDEDAERIEGYVGVAGRNTYPPSSRRLKRTMLDINSIIGQQHNTQSLKMLMNRF